MAASGQPKTINHREVLKANLIELKAEHENFDDFITLIGKKVAIDKPLMQHLKRRKILLAGRVQLPTGTVIAKHHHLSSLRNERSAASIACSAFQFSCRSAHPTITSNA